MKNIHLGLLDLNNLSINQTKLYNQIFDDITVEIIKEFDSLLEKLDTTTWFFSATSSKDINQTKVIEQIAQVLLIIEISKEEEIKFIRGINKSQMKIVKNYFKKNQNKSIKYFNDKSFFLKKTL